MARNPDTAQHIRETRVGFERLEQRHDTQPEKPAVVRLKGLLQQLEGKVRLAESRMKINRDQNMYSGVPAAGVAVSSAGAPTGCSCICTGRQ